jgi:heat shock protein HslJ
VLLIFHSCKTKHNQPEKTGSMIEKEKSSNLNREWMLKEIYNWNDSKEIIMKSEQKAYIVIKEKMSGYGGCNRIGGNFEQVNNDLSFGPILATRMACEGVGDEIEKQFMEVLDKTGKYEIKGHFLYLKDKDGKSLAELVAADWD